jgi:hypothetical protein
MWWWVLLATMVTALNISGGNSTRIKVFELTEKNFHVYIITENNFKMSKPPFKLFEVSFKQPVARSFTFDALFTYPRDFQIIPLSDSSFSFVTKTPLAPHTLYGWWFIYIQKLTFI